MISLFAFVLCGLSASAGGSALSQQQNLDELLQAIRDGNSTLVQSLVSEDQSVVHRKIEQVDGKPITPSITVLEYAALVTGSSEGFRAIVQTADLSVRDLDVTWNCVGSAFGPSVRGGVQLVTPDEPEALQLRKMKLLHSIDSRPVASITTEGPHPFFTVISYGWLEAADYLATLIGDVRTLRDDKGRSAVFYADSANAIGYLCTRGVSANDRDDLFRTVAYKFEMSSYRENLQLLVSHGLSLDTVDNVGNTPLMVAVRFGHLSALDALLHAGASWLDNSPLNNLGPLDLLVRNRKALDLITERESNASLISLFSHSNGDGMTPAESWVWQFITDREKVRIARVNWVDWKAVLDSLKVLKERGLPIHAGEFKLNLIATLLQHGYEREAEDLTLLGVE